MNCKLTLSVKLTAIFTLLIFVSVFTFSFLMIAFTKQSLERKQTEELSHFLNIVELGYEHSVREGIAFPSHAIPYYILYRISKVDGSLVRTNDALIPALPDTDAGQAATEFREGFFIDGNLNLLYMARTVGNSGEGGGYRVQVAMDLYQDNANLILQGLPRIFLLSAIPLLLISNIIAYIVSRRILRPLRRIIVQAQEITSEKLDSRLDESGAKDELQELAVTFNRLFSRLEEDFDKQRRFTSDAAHELKTPLAVISGHVDLLCRWGKENPAVLEESLQTLQKESRSMSLLIENLLQLTRAENNPDSTYLPENIQLQSFLQEIAADFNLIYPEVLFQLDCPSNAIIQCNQEALRQILRIFIKNSITYSQQPASVTLRWNGEAGQLSVADQGWGIAESDLGRIFDRFYRVDESRNRKTGGTGLGLSIARTLVDRLDLELEVQSLVGQGTTMFLKFPH